MLFIGLHMEMKEKNRNKDKGQWDTDNELWCQNVIYRVDEVFWNFYTKKASGRGIGLYLAKNV